MAYDSKSLEDYVDVAERIEEFRAKYPSHSLRGDWRVHELAGQAYIAYRAEAWRTPDDPAPGVGSAWELVPGRTPYTRGSELQNAETSAWGRAIIAVGAADSKRGIASRQEVEARRAEQDEPQRTRTKIPDAEYERTRHAIVGRQPEDRPAERVSGQPPMDMWMDNPPGEFDIGTPEDRPGSIDPRGPQMRNLQRLFHELGIEDRAVRLGMVSDMIGRELLTAKQLSQVEAEHVIKTLKAQQEAGTDG